MEKQLAALTHDARFPNDNQFRDKLETRELKGDLLGYLLAKLETYGKKEYVDTESLTIEHIMPQKLSSQWRLELGSDYERIHNTYLNTLGNLTLTGHNSKYSNKPFQEKCYMQDGFKQSPVWLNHSVRDCEVWNQASILNRAKLLSEKALGVWKGLPPYLTESVSDDEIHSYFTLSSEPCSVTNKQPHEVVLFNIKYPAKNWKELHKKVHNVLIEKDDLKFSEVLHDKLGQEKDFRTPLRLDNGYHIETHGSAHRLFEMCQIAVQAFTDNDEDFIVYVK
ncbi:MAG: HNH endonuclease family protein [Vampirovibrionales bacterium]